MARYEMSSYRSASMSLCPFLLLLALTLLPVRAAFAYEPPARILFGGDLAYPPLEWLDDNQVMGFNV
ncbi:MAG TPA: hypothetical protein VGR76_14775, partial [Candidatus Angelobacter sp.]|nr:hypothetical protein [Candidatus Angelobacter sp.]